MGAHAVGRMRGGEGAESCDRGKAGNTREHACIGASFLLQSPQSLSIPANSRAEFLAHTYYALWHSV